MSMTYAQTNPAIASTDTVGGATDGVFVPRYAQTRRKKKPVRTWMIVAPIGALAVIGTAAALMTGGGETAPSPSATVRTDQAAPAGLGAASAQPAAAVSVLQAEPVQATPVQATPVQAAPARAPAARAGTGQATAPRAAPTTAESPVVRVETQAEPAGPRPYVASPAAPTANATRAEPAIQTPAVPVQIPAVAVQPLD